MTDLYKKGDRVEWNWNNGSGCGTVIQVYHHGEINDNPAYLVKAHEGDLLMKSHSEVREMRI